MKARAFDVLKTISYHLKTGGTSATVYTLIDILEVCPNYVLFDMWGFNQPGQCDFWPRIAYVPVDQIKFRDRFPFTDWGEDAIMGEGRGLWDKFRQPIEHDRRYQALMGYFIKGTSWENTYLYEKAVRSIERKGHYRGISDPDLVKYRYDELYNSLKREGYISQVELFQRDANPTTGESTTSPSNGPVTQLGRFLVPDEVCVAIDRNGEFIRTVGGMNRLSIAKILELDDQIPVIIQLIHSEWDGQCDFEIQQLSLDHPLMSEQL